MVEAKGTMLTDIKLKQKDVRWAEYSRAVQYLSDFV